MTDTKITTFDEDAINQWIETNNNGWSFDGKWIRKTFKTHSWKSH